MEVNYLDGRYEQKQATLEEINETLKNPEVKTVTVHKPGVPGSVTRMSDGTEYITDINGSLRKLAGKKGGK